MEARGIATDATVQGSTKSALFQMENSGNSIPLEELDSFNLIEPPPLDWKSDSSSDAYSLKDVNELGSFSMNTPLDDLSDCGACSSFTPTEVEDLPSQEIVMSQSAAPEPLKNVVEKAREESEDGKQRDLDHLHIQTLLTQLQLFHPTPAPEEPLKSPTNFEHGTESHTITCLVPEVNSYQNCLEGDNMSGLLFTESHQRDLLLLLGDPESQEPQTIHSAQSVENHNEHTSQLTDCQIRYEPQTCEADEMASASYGLDTWHSHFEDEQMMACYSEPNIMERWQQFKGVSSQEMALDNAEGTKTEPSYKDVPGPCDPEDLLDGIIFGAKYLGSTQLQSNRNPSTNARMSQAQEAVDRIKAPEGESQPMTEVELFISTQRIKVLSADTQEAMMDHPLQMISYIADIESLVVLMVRRKPASQKISDSAASTSSSPKKCWMICHVFSSDDAQVIAQAIGQAFGVAYQQFLQANGIKASEVQAGEYLLGTQELYNGDLVHFSQSENIKEVCISKPVGEILGIAVVESGWGSILPTVVVANLLHGGAAERSGELSIGDRIMSVNGSSLVGLPITTCHSIIRDLKNYSQVKLSIVHCPPVTMAIIKRPDPKYQLGFSVEDGIICSLMRGGIAERGGIRVGHRIIEINGQSVVATPHDKIIHILSNAVGEIHLKTMPVSTYRLLTGQEQPVYL